MRLITALSLSILVSVPGSSCSQRLGLFTSQTGMNSNKVSMERIPYTATSGFYDFIQGTQLPDSVINGQSFYYVYFNIPSEVSEIGVRMISPVPSYVFPDAGDVVTEAYEANKKSTSGFNPSLFLEKGVSANTTETPITIDSWELLGKNDDNDEAPPQPNGKHTNALLRVYQGPYLAGIYRIKFKASEKEIPVGSYLIEWGCVPGVKRMKISRTPEGLFLE